MKIEKNDLFRFEKKNSSPTSNEGKNAIFSKSEPIAVAVRDMGIWTKKSLFSIFSAFFEINSGELLVLTVMYYRIIGENREK